MAEVILIILFILSILGILYSVFMLIRNNWVFRNRQLLLLKDFELYHKLPSYNTMMYTFWIWDIQRYLK